LFANKLRNIFIFKNLFLIPTHHYDPKTPKNFNLKLKNMIELQGLN